VYENRVLRRIFGPKREKVAGGWRMLQIEELHNLYASPNINSSRMRWLEHVAYMREMRNVYTILVSKSEGKKSLGSPKCRWEVR
jgi:hypothetical protein